MIKRFCDRCKKEIKSIFALPTIQYGLLNNQLIKVELCKNCYEEFNRFIGNENFVAIGTFKKENVKEVKGE